MKSCGVAMQILHTSFKKRKNKKPDAKQRELKASWEAMLKKHASSGLKKYPAKIEKKSSDRLSEVYSLGTPACRETPKIPSLPFTGGVCAKKANPVYTGTAIKGIGTMHKSNAVPIFSDEEAIDIAKMRR